MKCMLLYTSFNDVCSNLIDMSNYGPNLCIHASDKCFYDENSGCVQPNNDTDLYDCT